MEKVEITFESENGEPVKTVTIQEILGQTAVEEDGKAIVRTTRAALTHLEGGINEVCTQLDCGSFVN